MNKQEFLAELRANLSGLSKREIKERLAFYDEMIDDRTEEGVSQERAISEIGSIKEIAEQIKSEAKTDRSFLKGLRLRKNATAREKLLLVLGAPLWFPLLLAAFAVVFSLYAVLWSLVLTFWAIEIPFFIFAVISGCLLAGCKEASRLALALTVKGLALVKGLFSRKDDLS